MYTFHFHTVRLGLIAEWGLMRSLAIIVLPTTRHVAFTHFLFFSPLTFFDNDPLCQSPTPPPPPLSLSHTQKIYRKKLYNWIICTTGKARAKKKWKAIHMHQLHSCHVHPFAVSWCFSWKEQMGREKAKGKTKTKERSYLDSFQTKTFYPIASNI